MINLDDLFEGASKKGLETKIAKMCTCDGKECLEPSEHKKNCPARAELEKLNEEFTLPQKFLGRILSALGLQKAATSVEKNMVANVFKKLGIPNESAVNDKNFNDLAKKLPSIIPSIKSMKLPTKTYQMEMKEAIVDDVFKALSTIPMFKNKSMDEQGEIAQKVAFILDEYEPGEEDETADDVEESTTKRSKLMTLKKIFEATEVDLTDEELAASDPYDVSDNMDISYELASQLVDAAKKRLKDKSMSGLKLRKPLPARKAAPKRRVVGMTYEAYEEMIKDIRDDFMGDQQHDSQISGDDMTSIQDAAQALADSALYGNPNLVKFMANKFEYHTKDINGDAGNYDSYRNSEKRAMRDSIADDLAG